MEKMPESKLMARYMNDLEKEEDELISARVETGDLAKQDAGLEAELNALRAAVVEAAEGLQEAFAKSPVV